MACYMGCCFAKIRWLLFIVFALVAVACLTGGLIKCVPNLVALYKCTVNENSLQESGGCWRTFWHDAGVPFVVACIGAAALLLALLTCCCFCCASGPGAKKHQKDQFIANDAGANTYDTAGGDQYGYGGKPSVAHV